MIFYNFISGQPLVEWAQTTNPFVGGRVTNLIDVGSGNLLATWRGGSSGAPNVARSIDNGASFITPVTGTLGRNNSTHFAGVKGGTALVSLGYIAGYSFTWSDDFFEGSDGTRNVNNSGTHFAHYDDNIDRVYVGYDDGVAVSNIGSISPVNLVNLSSRIRGAANSDTNAVIVGETAPHVWSSVDGSVWTPGSLGSPTDKTVAWGVVYGSGKYIIHNTDGQYWSSNQQLDGWVPLPDLFPGDVPWRSRFIDGKFIILSRQGTIAYSTDGDNWVYINAPLNDGSGNVNMTDFNYVNGVIIVTGKRSQDGVWEIWRTTSLNPIGV